LLVFLTYVYHDARFRECNSSLLGLCLPVGLHPLFITFSVRPGWRTLPVSSMYSCSHILLPSSKIVMEKPSFVSTSTYHDGLLASCICYWNSNNSLACNSQSHISDTSKSVLVSDTLIRHSHTCRSQWPRGLRGASAATRLLSLCVRIPPGAWVSVS
jgi:hypothetical protein